ncbi:MAG: S8 family peptidase, partial [Planctomycetota bacterium]
MCFLRNASAKGCLGFKCGENYRLAIVFLALFAFVLVTTTLAPAAVQYVPGQGAPPPIPEEEETAVFLGWDRNRDNVERYTRTHPGVDYVPNEIIVKFKRQVADTVEMQLNAQTSANQLKLSNNLDNLNARYAVKKIKPVFKDFKKHRQRLKALQQKNKSLLNKKERHILRRLSRAPKGAKVPELDRIYKIEVEPEAGESLEDIVEAYNNDPDVEYAELNYIVSTLAVPDDPYYSIQWPLNNTGQMYPDSGRFNEPPGTPDADIDAPEAWDVHTGSSDIVVAVIDTGVDYTHRDLQSNMWINEMELHGEDEFDDDENGYDDDIYGYDYVNSDSDPMDDYGHGTHCAGTIAAEGDNGLDIAGVCWNARIMALKFLGAGGSGCSCDAVQAFYYAVNNGADVTSNSWGGGGYSETMENVIAYAYSQGVVMVAAAGNDADTAAHYPAYYDHMISVAATDSDDQKASFSTHGDWVEIAAPGVDVLSLRASETSMGTTYDDYTTIASGTSMACPHVAGAGALLLSADPTLTPDDVCDILMNTADAIAPEVCISGRLNLFNAMLEVILPKGNIKLNQDYYNCSDQVGIRLNDLDLAGQGSHAVSITTDGGDSETVTLTEATGGIGAFTGSIPTGSGVPNTEDGIVQVAHEQIITATYEDANDGTGNPATASDTAETDCAGPVVSNVQVYQAGSRPTITFETDEFAAGRILCGLACGGPYTIEANEVDFTISHSITLIVDSPETDYFFIIEANDVLGNQTVDNNDGNCFTFTTEANPGDTNVPGQYPTIQEAIDHSWEDVTIWVADGTYTGDGNRDIDFLGKAITVKSENGPNDCIIDCAGTETDPHRGFYFHNGEDANSILDG